MNCFNVLQKYNFGVIWLKKKQTCFKKINSPLLQVMSRFDSTPFLENNGALTQYSDVTGGFYVNVCIRKTLFMNFRAHPLHILWVINISALHRFFFFPLVYVCICQKYIWILSVSLSYTLNIQFAICLFVIVFIRVIVVILYIGKISPPFYFRIFCTLAWGRIYNWADWIIYIYIGSEMIFHFIRYLWNELCVLYPRAFGEGIKKHTTSFINTVWNENSFQILFITW